MKAVRIVSSAIIFLMLGCSGQKISQVSPEQVSGQLQGKTPSSKDYPKTPKDENYFEFSSYTGEDDNALKKNCNAYYSEYWKRKLEGNDNAIDKIQKIISDPGSDIKIKSKMNRIAIIKRTDVVMNELTDGVEDIFVFRSGRWEVLHGVRGEDEYTREVQLLYLNNDEYIDAIVYAGFGNDSWLKVFIGDKDQVLIYRQRISTFGNWKKKFYGKCNYRIDITPFSLEDNQKPESFVFDCEISGFKLQE